MNKRKNKENKKGLIDRIREPDPMRPAFGRRGLRHAIREAFELLEEAPKKKQAIPDNAPIFSQETTADTLIKRYSAVAVSHKMTGVLHSEEELQEQLEWYRMMVPWIVKTEFNRHKRGAGK